MLTTDENNYVLESMHVHVPPEPTCKHFHELAAYCAEECDARLASNGTSKVRLAGTWGTLEDDTLRS